MAAVQARPQQRAETREEDEPVTPLPDQAASVSTEREWLIFQPATVVSSPSLNSASSLEPASVSSEDWQGVGPDGATADSQIGSLPVHDGQGIFTLDESEMEPSLYASAQPHWIGNRAGAASDSTRLSFSTSGSAAEIFKPVISRSVAVTGGQQPLTEHALAAVPDNRLRRARDEEEEAALTASSDDEQLSEVEEQLSRTPQAVSAGLQITPRSRRKADHAGMKRRHRQSGLSDKGSKRSNTSSNAAVLSASTVGLANAERKSEPGQGLLLGKVVRKMFSVDEDLLDMVATSPPMPTERESIAFPSAASMPRAPARPSRFRRRMTLGNEPGLTSFTKHLRDEMGDFSGYAAGMTDSGEDTEMEVAPSMTPRLSTLRTASSDVSRTRPSEGSPARSMSVSSLPVLLESMYSSLPSELLRSQAANGTTSPPMRRIASLDDGSAHVEPRRISRWWALIARLRAGLESAM